MTASPLKFWTHRHRAKGPQASTSSLNVLDSRPLQPRASSACDKPLPDPCAIDERDFLASYPAYAETSALDELRSTDLQQLDSGETYVDWMGSAVFPRSLVARHADLLMDPQNVFGNTHSGSQSSQLSSKHTSASRSAVLNFFDADPSEYAVVFTQNATAALKLVGESFPWAKGSHYVVPVDAHNSVHGIRCFAEARGAQVSYYDCGDRGGPNMLDLHQQLLAVAPVSIRDARAPSLLAVTGLSNVTNAKAPLRPIIALARATGVHILLDAAALAPTSKISLRETPVDAMAVSFYKMFGYPTGVGGLIVRRDFMQNVLRRAWFAGGTVDVVQVPGSGNASFTFATDDSERFEDGTLNFLSIAAVRHGLSLLSHYRILLPLRLSILTHWLWTELSSSQYASGSPMVHVVSTPPAALQYVGQESRAGSTVSFVMLDASRRPIRNDVVEETARSRIALRAGCMCNAGGVVTLLHRSKLFVDEQGESHLQEWMDNLHVTPSLASKEAIGPTLFNGDTAFGVLRVSLGLGSNFRDAWNVVQWVRSAATTLGG